MVLNQLLKQIDYNSDMPLHKQIEGALRDLIKSGEYDEGKLFPSEVDLSNTFGVSRSTVRQAFNTLVNEGLLERKRGKGTIVSEKDNISTHSNEWISFTKEMHRKGIAIKDYRIEFKEVDCDREVAEVLNIAEGRKIKKLVRIKGDMNEPFVKFVSWFHPRIPVTAELDYHQPLNDILENEFSILPMRSSEELQAILADSELSADLGICEGTPVLFRKRIVYDAGKRIIEYNKCYYRHDKMKYKIDIVRDI